MPNIQYPYLYRMVRTQSVCRLMANGISVPDNGRLWFLTNENALYYETLYRLTKPPYLRADGQVEWRYLTPGDDVFPVQIDGKWEWRDAYPLKMLRVRRETVKHFPNDTTMAIQGNRSLYVWSPDKLSVDAFEITSFDRAYFSSRTLARWAGTLLDQDMRRRNRERRQEGKRSYPVMGLKTKTTSGDLPANLVEQLRSIKSGRLVIDTEVRRKSQKRNTGKP
jgi:hypothetical protein